MLEIHKLFWNYFNFNLSSLFKLIDYFENIFFLLEQNILKENRIQVAEKKKKNRIPV